MSKYVDVLFAKVDTAASGDNAIVAATTGKRVRVYQYALVAGGAVSIKWRSNTTDLSGPMPFAANGGMAVSGSRDFLPLVQTAAGENLNLNLAGAVQVSGHITYALE